MSAMTRGPLPARVYWTRRVLALAVVLGLVVAVVQIVSLVGGGSAAPPDRAAPVAAGTVPSETPADAATEDGAPDQQQGGQKKRKKKNKKDRNRGPELAAPEGECADRDIAVTPTLEEAVGGSPVVFTLDLRTISSPACTWEVSPDSLTVKVTSGADDIWFSSQCRRAIKTQDVIIRNNANTPVEVTWSARRSDEGCTRFAAWALPGWYHVEAAAFAGEPSDLQFRLTAPDPEVVTETVPPNPKNGQGKKNDQKNGEKKNRDRRRD